MERAFKITPQASFYKRYFEWHENSKRVNEIVKELMQDYKIDTTFYGISCESFYIFEPSDWDLDRFGDQLCKSAAGDTNNGRRFKKNSEINKDLRKRLSDNQLAVISEPSLAWEVSFSGRIRTRKARIKDDLYCILEALDATEKLSVPDGFEEIKMSEFYAIYEKATALSKQESE